MTEDEPARVWIHIGLPKTGTSAVQTAFKDARPALRSAGLDYPATGELGGGHARLAWPLLAERRQQQADVQERLDSDATRSLWLELAEEVRGTGCPQVLVSTEYFSEGDPEALAELARLVSSEVRILVYLRRQDELIESGYNQSVKAGLATHKFAVGPYAEGYDYARLLGRWAAVFGRDNVTVRRYDAEVAQRGVVYDVAEVLGIDAGLLHAADSQANPSLHPALVELQRIANAVGAPSRDLVALVQGQVGALSGSAVRSFLSPEERRKVLDVYAESNAQVARSFFGEDQLFIDPAEDAEFAARHVSGEQLAAAIALAWRELSGQVAGLRAEVDELRRLLPPPPDTD